MGVCNFLEKISMSHLTFKSFNSIGFLHVKLAQKLQISQWFWLSRDCNQRKNKLNLKKKWERLACTTLVIRQLHAKSLNELLWTIIWKTPHLCWELFQTCVQKRSWNSPRKKKVFETRKVVHCEEAKLFLREDFKMLKTTKHPFAEHLMLFIEAGSYIRRLWVDLEGICHASQVP